MRYLAAALAIGLGLVGGGAARAEGEGATPVGAPGPVGAPAPAGPTVVVLRLDATAGIDAGLIERVQRAVEDRATRSGLTVTTGAANLADTAALAGCTAASEPGCADQILDTLGADELVYGTVDRSMGGHRVTVARARRGTPPQVVVVEVPAGDLDAASRVVGPGLDQLFPGAAAGASTAGGDPALGGPPPPVETAGRGSRLRTILVIGGLAVGGALLLGGALEWNAAAGLQDDIDAAPDRTPDDVAALRALEDRAAGHATRGNWLVVAGAVVAGGTAAWWLLARGEHHAPAPVARLAPWITPEGAGVALTWGTP